MFVKNRVKVVNSKRNVLPDKNKISLFEKRLAMLNIGITPKVVLSLESCKWSQESQLSAPDISYLVLGCV